MSTFASRPSRHFPTANMRRPAFSLIEMLTVIGILAIVLGIIIPVLGGARNAARKSATQATLADLSVAMNQFQISERRLPGYFSAADMGSSENGSTSGAAQQGLSEMENIMLDLAGGIVGSGVTLGTGVIEVGPRTDPTKRIRVDVALIGASKQATSGSQSKGYFTPDAKNFKVQTGTQDTGLRISAAGNAALPVMVDSWGQPILAWRQNAAANARATFAGVTSDTTPSRFYYASNAAFLRSTRLGKLGANQDERSLLGTGGTAPSDASRIRTLEALIGSPAFPVANSNPAVPSAARGPIVLHSAGTNGIFLDKDSRGGKVAGTGATASVKYVAATGTNTPDPITGGAFEDLLYTAGN